MEMERKLQQQYSHQKKIDFKIKTVIRDKQGFQVALVVKNLPANAGDIRDAG